MCSKAKSGILSLIFTPISLCIKASLDPKCCFFAQDASNGSLVKQYPPTPIQGYIKLECVGLILIASTTSYKLTSDSSANLDHSVAKAIFMAL